MGQMFDIATSPVALRAAMEKVIGNRGGPGGDAMTVSTLAAQGPLLLARLHAELAEGVYRPGPLRRVAVPKRSGGNRTLAIPCVIDRVVQSAVAVALSPQLDAGFSPDSFAYRPGRGVRQAVARVAMLRRAGYHHVVDGDIRAFFDTVPHAPLLAKLQANVDDPALVALVRLWLEGWDLDDVPGRGLAQGSPLSPLLANLHLDALDDRFAGGPVRIVRFADDFLLLARNGGQAERALAEARALLEAHGLELHPDKTRIVAFDERLDFLGHLFLRSVTIEQDREEAAEAWREMEAEAAAATLRAGGPLPFIPPSRGAPPSSGSPPADLRLPPTGPAAIGIEAVGPVDDMLETMSEERDIDDFAPGLAPLYLLDPDARLAASGECFIVERGGVESLRVPVREVGRVEAGPRVRVDETAIRLAADHRRPLALLDGEGRALAMLLPPVERRAGRHLAQARLVLDEARRLTSAKAMVEARLRNQYALLKRLNRRRKLEAVEGTCARIKRLWRLDRCADLEALRGREGEAAAQYWRALGHCLEHGFTLSTRRAEPANPVNALLDWLAHLLTRDTGAAVARAGLHPGFGALHESGDLRDALAYDLVEAFRAPLAEGLAVYLFNNRMLRREDFLDSGGRSRLTGDAARRALIAYEKWLARPVRDPRRGRMTSWRMLISEEARAYAAALDDSGEPFVPYRMDW